MGFLLFSLVFSMDSYEFLWDSFVYAMAFFGSPLNSWELIWLSYGFPMVFRSIPMDSEKLLWFLMVSSM